VKVAAPGRVNLIGDHTDYTGGLVLPMAIDRWTVVDCEPLDGAVELDSDDEPGAVRVALGEPFDPQMTPRWGRYVSAVTSLMRPLAGIRGRVSTTIPIGGGLSSSAALELATAVALGFDGSARDLALLGQRAEHLATGVPTGIMDQLCISSARAGHGTLIDCQSLEVEHVPIPESVHVVVRFVVHRTLEGSEYAARVDECARAEREIGPLRLATPSDVASIADATLRRRARHVITENQRVREFAEAIDSGELTEAGRLMTESHRSLAEDYEVSTPRMDSAVTELLDTSGVLGARMTGGGFGGCVVALCRAGATVDGWSVRPVAAVAQASDH